MASFTHHDKRIVFRLIGAVAAAWLVLGAMGRPAWADDPPSAPPGSAGSSTTQPDAGKPVPHAASQPVHNKGGARDDLGAAKRAAIASIGRGGAGKQEKPAVGGEKPIGQEAEAGVRQPGVPVERTIPRDGRNATTQAGRTAPPSSPRQTLAPPVPKPAAPAPEKTAATPTSPPTPAAGRTPPIRQPGQPGHPAAPGPAGTGGPPGRPGPARPAGVDHTRPDLRPTSPTPGGTPGAAEGAAATSAPAPVVDINTTMTFTIGPPDPEARTYRFEYDNTPWPDVLADFSRMSGLPWLNSPEPPLTDFLTFRSPREFTYKEALEQLNELLLSRALNKYLIQRKDNYLTINRLPDLMREIPPQRMFQTFEAFEAAKLERFDIALTYFDVPKGWSAFQVIEEFRPMFSDTYGTQVVGDRIELTGLVEEHYRFRDVVLKLAAMPPPPPDPRPTLTLSLKVAKAVDVANTLRQLFPTAGGPVPKTPGGPGVDRQAEQAKQVTILPDPKNNKLIVKAPNDVLTELAKMVEDLDAGSPAEPQVTKVVKLEHAGALALQMVLKPLFQGQKAATAQRAAREYVPPEVEAEYDRDLLADQASNAVILTGSRKGVESAEAIVKQWDVADTNDASEIIELRHAEAAMVASTLAVILAPQQAKGGGPPPRITPQSSSKLLISCSKNELQRVHELIEKLDVASDDEAKEHFVQLKIATPSVIAQVLQQVIGGQGAPRMMPARPMPGQPVPQMVPMPAGGAGGTRFIPDDASGLLIVYCSDKDWERVQSLIRKLDDQAGTIEPVMRSFVLRNADASDVANMLQQLFPPAAARAPGVAPQLFSVDPLHNALNIFAKADFIEKVAPFIEQLDIQTEAPLTVIHLEHARAEVIAPILSQSFGAGGGGVMMSRPGVPGVPGQPVMPRPMPGGAGGSGVRIVAEPITNSLLVSAPPKELEQIKQLVADMERAEGDKSESRVILVPENRSATEIAETLMSLTGSAVRPRPGGAPGAVIPAVLTGGAGGLKAVASGNRVILDGPRDEVAKAVQLFEQIDVVDQKPLSRKYVVKDAEEDAKKLQVLLGLSAGGTPSRSPAAGPAGGRPGAASPQPQLALTGSGISIYSDTYENVLLIRALPKDFVVIDEQLRLILGESEQVAGTEPIEHGVGSFFTYQLKHKKALDIGWTLEDLVNPGGRGGVRFEEGPDERTLLVRGCKPAQKEEIIKYIEMFDIPSATAGPADMLVIDSDKLPAEQLAELLRKNYRGPTGEKLVILGPSAAGGGRVPVVDIHEGEDDEEQPKAPKAPTGGTSVNPCVLPASMVRLLGAIPSLSAHEFPRGGEQQNPGAASPPMSGQPTPVPLLPPVTTQPAVLLSPPATTQNPLAAGLTQPRPPATSAPASGEPSAASSKEISATAPPTATARTDVEVMVDPETGKLLVFGSAEQLASVEGLIDELTGGKTPTVYRVFPLRNVDVNVAAQLLNNVFNQTQAAPTRQPRQQQPQQGQQGHPNQPAQPAAAAGGKGAEGGRAQPQQPQPEPAPPPGRIRVIPDARIRSLYVVAPLSDIPIIVDILRHIDKKMPPGEGSIRFFRLINLDATQVVQNLKELLGLGAGGPRQTRQTAPGQRGQPTPEQMQQMQQQQQVLQMQGQEGQGVLVTGEENVQLTAVTQINSILAKAPPDTLTLIENLINKMEEQPDTTKQEMRRIPLVHARATDVATIVRDIAQKVAPGAPGGGPGGPGGGGRRGGAVSVNADARTNSVILAGQVVDLDAAEKVVKELDIDDGRGSNVKQISVKGDAQSIATAIKSVFVAGGPQAQDIIITADQSTGTIVVKAPAPQMAEIEKQIADMDSKVAVEQQRRSVKMQVGDAETIAQSLQGIFADTKTKGGAKQNIAIKGVKSNNTIYVTGADDEVFEQISAMAKEMDSAPSNVQVRTFPLKYASAVDIEQKLTTMMAKAMQTGGLGNVKLDLVGVVPDVRTNSLIVTGGPVTFVLIDDVLKQVDIEPQLQTKLETKAYPFKPPVVAADVARNINELFKDESAKTTGVNPPTVTFNAAGNIVTVTANATQHEKIQKSIIEPLLAAVGEPLQDYQVPLKYARADEVKATLEDFMNKWRQGSGNRPQDAFNITADANSNMLLINCSPSTKAVFDKQLAELDKEAVVLAGERTPRAYILKYANPQSVQDAITKQFARTSGARTAERDQVTTSTDLDTKTVVVTANEANHKKAKEIVEMMDVEAATERITKAFSVKYVTPWTMATTINQQFQRAGRSPSDQVMASYEDGTRAIIVTASPKNMEQVEKLIAGTDQAPEYGAKETRFIQLKNARADELVRPLTESLQAKTMPDQRGRYPVTITADIASNNLMVTATADMFDEIQQMVAQLDVKQQGDTERVRQVFTLSFANPDSVVRTIQEAFKQTGRSPSPRDNVACTTDTGTNSVIVTAAKDNMAEIAKLISEMDQRGETVRKEYVIEVANSNPNDVANALQQIFDAAIRGRPGQSSATVKAVPGSTKIVAFANEQEYQQIQSLIKQIDVEGGRTVHTVPMPEMISAKSVAENINKLFGGPAGRKDGPSAEFHEPTNTLLVFATDTEFEKINEQVVKVLSEQPAIGALKIFKIPLKYAVADEVAKTLQDFFDKKAGVQRGGSNMRPPWWGGGTETTAKQLENQVTIIAEPASNMLIAYCTDTTKEVIDDLLKDIDTDEPPGGKKLMEMVALKYMDATEMLAILTEYLKVSKRTPETTGQENSWWWGGGGRRGQEQEKTVLAGDTRLSVVESMNAIIVVGKPESVQDVLAKIKELDVEQTDGANVPQTIKLVNANATMLADTLDRTFNDPSRKKAGGAAYVPPTIVAVEATNSLIVRAKPAEFALIKKMAEGLDSEMAGETGGVRILPVPVGRNVEELAATIERQINESEDNKKKLNKDYRPSLVSIGADATSNALLVAASKAQFEEVKRLVDELVAMGPAGGMSRKVIKLKTLSPDKVKQLIEQFQQGGQGKGGGARPSGGGARPSGGGPRGDADWKRNRRDEKMMNGGGAKSARTCAAAERAERESQSPRIRFGRREQPFDSERLVRLEEAPGGLIRGLSSGCDRPRSRFICAATLPVFFAQLVLSTAVAQVPSSQPAASQPKTFIINKVEKKEPPARPTEGGKQPSERPQAAGQGRTAAATQPAEAKDKKPPPRERPTSQPAAGKEAKPPARPAANQQAGGAGAKTAEAPARPGGPKEPPKGGPKEPPKGAATEGRGRAASQPVLPPGMTPEQWIRATTQPAGLAISPEAQAAIRQRLSGAPITVGEAGPDTMVVEANEQDLEVIESLIQMLDMALPEKKIEYIRLSNARATDLAKTLADVFAKVEKKGDRQVRPEDQVHIIADPRTNGIYLAATEEKMAEAMKLINQNETASKDIDKRVRSFTFQNRRVFDAGPVLQKMVKSYLDQMGLPAAAITVEADLQTNSVLITGGEADLAFVEKIIQGLDAEMPETKEGQKSPMGQADILVLPLRVADADALGKLLNEMLKKAATGDTPMKDFIRRMRLLDENGEPIATVDLNRPIVLTGDKDSNSLIIASSRENCLIMKEVAKAFDREPARAEVTYKVMRLEYADADGVAEQIGKLLKESEELTKRASGKGEKFGVPDGAAGALVYTAVVKADPRTNQILLVGRPEAVTILEGLVKNIDIKGLDVMPFEIIKLEYASATALETALSEMMKDRADALPKGTGPNADKAEKVVIKGDPRARSLIIAAKAGRMEELRKLIKELDVPSTALIEDIRTITVRKCSAVDLADKLKKLWEDRQKQQESGSKGLKLEIPAIVADERSNSLIVAASKADFEAIKSVVDKIEALELNPMANIYVIHLKYNSAKQLSSALKALFDKRAEMRTVDGKVRPEDKVAIEVDEVSNALLVAASRENYDVLMQKVQELDQELGVPGQVEFFVCDNVQAQRVKDTIDELFKEGVYKPGATGESAQAKTREKVTVTIDDRSNILIVSASPENMELVREIYKRMNSVATPWDAAITKLIVIEYGDAVKIAAQVKDHFQNLDKIRQEGSSGKAKSAFGITVFADERSNRIVVGGTKDGIDSAVDMIRKLDVPPGEPGSQPVVYTLKEAPASKVGEMIKNIFQERNQPRQGATGPQIPNVKVTVESNDASNSLVINAAKEDHILIADLIARLDRPSTLLDMVKVFPLERARSDRVKEILEELYKSAGGADSKGKTIAVVEDKRTNAVVVAAPPGELGNIASLVGRLDETEVKGQAEIGVFVCENEDAKKMSELLNEVMTGKLREGGGGGGGKEEGLRELSSMLISYAAKDPRGKEIFLKAIRENVQISYSERANSVIVVAPATSLKLIEHLVRQLDQIQKRPVLVKVFPLMNSDAQSIIDLLDKMFAKEAGSEQEKEFQKDREMRVEGGVSATGAVPTAMSQGGFERKGTFGRPKTTFVAEQRTNSVIAAGWPEDIDVVADIIDQLDSRAIQDRDNVVVALVNMKAKDVQAALDSFVKAEQARLEKIGKDISVQRRMEQEISVIAHEESNQLIVSASPRYKPQILSIIEQLDQAPPQVMIQVMLAEVTLDDRFEMGMEFALQQLRFSETAVAGGNGVLQSSHFDVIGGTDVGAAGSGLAGFSFTITGEDFNFLVRALQSDSRLEVIQRPMVMCQDNQKANITVGQQVPFIRGTQVSTAGQVTSQVEYEKVGIILDVEPHINPDGFVFLKVKPEVSAIATSTIDIGNGVLAPVFTTRSAETTVAVKDGETVVIGGLITTTETEGESKVPFLGDIPGLGILFRSTTRSKGKTELLIALTPRVVRTIEDGRRLSVEERDGSGIITDTMKASPLFGKLRLQPEAEGEIPEIETLPPGQAIPPTGPQEQPGKIEPPVEPAPEEKYGPTAPKYGPLLPAGEDVVAQGDRRLKHAAATGPR